jgi:hypothetical protein
MVYDEITLEQSKAVLDELLGEFPFVDGRSKAVQVSAMLSLFGLNLLTKSAQVPMFLYTANAPRAGKTLLMKTVIVPVMGMAAVQTLSGEEEELRKVLDTVVRGGVPYLALDNLKRRVSSPALEAFATSAAWGGRIMGVQEDFVMPKQTIVLITANHAQVSTDISGRALFVDLWVAEADPQAREIKRTMDDSYLARPDVRQRILSALWGLIRHWDAQGQPAGPRRLAGFEEWSRTIGGIVLAAGYGDPLAEPELVNAGDPDAQDMQSLVKLLADKDQPEEGFDFSALVDVCLENSLFEGLLDGKWVRPGGGDKEFELSPKGRSRFGKLLIGYEGRVFRWKDGSAIRFGKRGRNHARRYRVEEEVAG